MQQKQNIEKPKIKPKSFHCLTIYFIVPAAYQANLAGIPLHRQTHPQGWSPGTESRNGHALHTNAPSN